MANNMSSVRFFSLEPLQLDIIPNRDSQKGDAELRLSEKYAQLQRCDTSNKLAGLSVESSILSTIERSQVPQATLQTSRPVKRQRSLSVAAASVASRSITSTISRFCNTPAIIWKGTYLKDISASIQQIDVRNEQARLLPGQYRMISRLLKQDLPSASAQYIHFYNCVWLILNDMIVGWTFGTFLRDNSELLGNLVGLYTTLITVQMMREGLLWLDDWPAGLKLNTELSHFFCQSYLAGIDVWSGGLTSIVPYFPHIIYLIGCSGPLGFTMTLSLISDVIGLLTAPLYFSYLVATSIFRTQLSAAGSLWRLFRGKRRNVLQNRTDAWEYDMDQLLLGTILFTLLAFLFPTIVVYYLLFAVVRLLTIFVHASLETLLVFMNHFPLFTVMLRLKDPARLPGGVYIVLEGAERKPVIKNSPIPLSRIFFQYLRLWSNLTAHYSPLRLLKCLLTGGFITPIERYSIRYDSSAPS